jgi:hypothetical protein
MSDFSITWMLWIFYISVAMAFLNIIIGVTERSTTKVWMGIILLALYGYPVWEHALS